MNLRARGGAYLTGTSPLRQGFCVLTVSLRRKLGVEERCYAMRDFCLIGAGLIGEENYSQLVVRIT